MNNDMLLLLSVDSGEIKRIPTNIVRTSDPSFSPDGQWLAFSVNPMESNGDIYIIRVDGSDLRCLTCVPGSP